jgi:hypothetical protein
VRDLAKRLVLTAQKDQTILLPCKDFRQYCGLIGNAAPEWRRLGYWLEFFALVEAAGIEPASEDINIQASTCVAYGLYLILRAHHRHGPSEDQPLRFRSKGRDAPSSLVPRV